MNDNQINEITRVLSQINYPEMNIDLENLGLIYDIKVNKNIAEIRMTLPTPGSKLTNDLKNEINQAVTSVKGINSCAIQLVWYPAWSPKMIKLSSEEQAAIKKSKTQNQSQNKVIDFNTPIKQFADKYPDFIKTMVKAGFTKISNPILVNTVGRKVTINEGAQMMKLDLHEIKKVFREEGFQIND